jgi:hypothetical protein
VAFFCSVYFTAGLGIWSWIEANGLSIHGTRPRHFLLDLVIRPIVWFIGGYYFGVRMWENNEKKYLMSGSQLK